MKFTIDDKTWITFQEGMELYSLSYVTFKKLAFEADAVVYWGVGKRLPRVRRDKFEQYFQRML